MAKALAVASYIARWFASGDENDLTPMKLQKLLYYSQGFFLAVESRKLFDSKVEAWEHGPVVRDVYTAYKDLRPNESNYIVQPHPGGNPDDLTEPERVLVDDVLDVYGELSANRLRNMTHDEPPWKETYVEGQKKEIPPDLMKSFFTGLVVQQ
jgi:uncharacterized phage-associated protein